MESLVPFVLWPGGALSTVCLILAFKNIRRETQSFYIKDATGLPGAAHSALKTTLIGVQEQYPVLGAMPAFQNLQRNLVDTEQRIALARDYFNNIATRYNTRLEQVPDCYVAPLIGMRRFPLLAAENFERAPIPVSFAK